jgi:hypothetical protein
LIESIEEHRRAKRRRGSPLVTAEKAIEDYHCGRFVIIVDDESRENEGDLTIPAQFVTAETISFMLKYTTGVICVPMTGERLDELHIPMMVGQQQNRAQFGTAFTVSVDAHSRQGRPGPHRSRLQVRGCGHAGAYVPLESADGRRPRTSGPDGGLR